MKLQIGSAKRPHKILPDILKCEQDITLQAVGKAIPKLCTGFKGPFEFRLEKQITSFDCKYIVQKMINISKYIRKYNILMEEKQFAFQNVQAVHTKHPRQEIRPMVDDQVDLGGCYQSCIYSCGECCGTCRTYLPCFCCVQYPYQQIDQSFVGLFQRFGKYVKTMGPGLQYFNPCTDVIQVIDVKTRIIDLARQSAITRDNITVVIDATVYFNIIQPRHSHYLVSNINKAVRQLTCSTLRTIAGQYIMQDLLQKRQQITVQLGKFVARHVRQWGIQISNILIKDIILSHQLQQTLSSAAKQRRLAQSKIISARADVESAKLMRQTADILSSKSAMQIRYLQTIKNVTNNNSCKVIFISDQ